MQQRREKPMHPSKAPVKQQVPPQATHPDQAPTAPQAINSHSTKEPDLASTARLLELVEELAQAYEDSLSLQNSLRPLMPRTTWRHATAASRRSTKDWPVQELTATIMFTDISDFTAIMEAHQVGEVLDSLNHYFALLSQIVQRNRGDVHKFLGDGLMALFIHPADAVQAGLEIQRALEEFNNRQEAQGLWRFETRLAIDTGEIVLASVGSPERQDYTLIGRPVNQAAHLSENTPAGKVWISQNTYDGLADKEGFIRRSASAVKRREKLPIVYETTCTLRDSRRSSNLPQASTGHEHPLA
jgi:class 3 adenylate cyclase